MRCEVEPTCLGSTLSWRLLALAISLFALPAFADNQPPAASPGSVASPTSSVVPPSSADAPTAADPLAECLAPGKSGRKTFIEDEFCLLRMERLGTLSIGIGEKEALAALPCPVSKGKEEFSEATSDYNQKWSFPACGVNLTMASSAKGGPKVVTSIVIFAPSTLATTRGIHIGSTEEEVLAAYAPFVDRGAGQRGKTIVAGSIYGGMIISIADSKVSEIFLGAAAE